MLINCQRCRKPCAVNAGSHTCSACLFDEQADARKIHACLREHPMSTVDDIVQKTGLSLQRVLLITRQARLKLGNKPEVTACSRCRGPLSVLDRSINDHNSLSFCKACTRLIAGQLRSAIYRPPATVVQNARRGPDADRRYGLHR